eukprot:11357163-Alexandrium_andersonii.AAC.1
MSASLVGSEMCIRDRPLGNQFSPRSSRWLRASVHARIVRAVQATSGAAQARSTSSGHIVLRIHLMHSGE